MTYYATVELFANTTFVGGSVVIADVVIRSGRTQPDDMNPATCTFQLLEGGPPLGIADTVEIRVDGATQFTGRIGEITTGHSSAGDPVLIVVAAGTLARSPRILIPMPLPAQTANDRARAILTAGGITPSVYGGYGLHLAAVGVSGDDPQSLSALLQSLAQDTGAIVADQPGGDILVQFLDSRVSDDEWTPDPAATFVDVEWQQTDDLINDCQIEYAGGVVGATNAGSIARYGPHQLRLSTGLADLAGASTRAGSVVARLANPVWAAGSVQTADPAVFDHGIGALVTLAPLHDAPVGGSWTGVLEGVEHHYRPAGDGSDRMSAVWILALSDRQHSAEVIVWNDVDPTLQWRGVDPTCTWAGATSNGDLRPSLAAAA